MSKQVHEIIVNGDTFLLPPFRFDQYTIVTECPETGRKSSSSVIASEGSITVPELGCTVEFYNSDGTSAEAPIKLVREDADKLAEKMRAHEEAQRKADAEKEAAEKEAAEKEAAEKEAAEKEAAEKEAAEKEAAEKEAAAQAAADAQADAEHAEGARQAAESQHVEDASMTCEDSMPMGMSDCDSECSDACDTYPTEDAQLDDQGDYTYPSED